MNIRLHVVDVVVNEKGLLCLVIEVEGERRQVEIIGVELNQEWKLGKRV